MDQDETIRYTTFNHNQISTFFRGLCSFKWGGVDVGFLKDVQIAYSCDIDYIKQYYVYGSCNWETFDLWMNISKFLDHSKGFNDILIQGQDLFFNTLIDCKVAVEIVEANDHHIRCKLTCLRPIRQMRY